MNACKKLVSATLMLALLFTTVAANPALSAAVSPDDPAQFNHQFAEINGIKMHYVDEGEGPVVVLLHGYPLLWYSWRKQIPALVEAGYRVVVPDQRGYGQTEQPEEIEAYNLTQLTGDVVGLLNHLGVDSAVVAGWDWGTPVAWTTAQLRPDLVRGLVLVSTPYQQRGPMPPSKVWPLVFKQGTFYQEYFQEPGKADREKAADPYKFMMAGLYSLSASAKPEEQWRFVLQEGETIADVITVPEKLPDWLSQQAMDYYAAEFTRSGFTGALNWYRNLDRNWQLTPFLDGAKIYQPTLFMAGETDPGIKWGKKHFDNLEKTVPNLRKKVLIPGASHLAPEEQPEQVNQLLIEFLRNLEN